jgi:hypothetical protein
MCMPTPQTARTHRVVEDEAIPVQRVHRLVGDALGCVHTATSVLARPTLPNVTFVRGSDHDNPYALQ